MGKLDLFRIHMANNQVVFYGGQVIYGHVEISLNQPMKMRAIRLHMEGKGAVHWTESSTSGSGKDSHTTTDTYSANETYFNHILMLYGKGIRLHIEGKGRVHWTERHTTGSGKNRHTTTRTYSANEAYFDHILVLYGKEIRLCIEGRSRVHWTERHKKKARGGRHRTTTRTYSAQQTYFEHCLVLYGKAPDAGGDNPTHPAGAYTYHFQYQVPIGCPSSFEGSVGRVRYTMKAVIDKPWKFDHKCVTAFTVLNPLDLNRDPFSLTTPSNAGSKTLCCLCCASGPINVQCRLNRGGFVPGDSILICAEIENGSDRVMNSSYAELHQTIRYHATSKTREESRIVNQIHMGAIQPHKTEMWDNVALAVPAVPPSRLDGCNIIDIQYYIKFVVDPSGPAMSLSVPVTVLIGTFPLLSAMGMPANTPAMPPPTIAGPSQPQIDPSAPPGPMDNNRPFTPYADMPPPSYAECAFGKVNIKEEGDKEARGDDFAPVYTYYNWGDHPRT